MLHHQTQHLNHFLYVQIFLWTGDEKVQFQLPSFKIKTKRPRGPLTISSAFVSFLCYSRHCHCGPRAPGGGGSRGALHVPTQRLVRDQ